MYLRYLLKEWQRCVCLLSIETNRLSLIFVVVEAVGHPLHGFKSMSGNKFSQFVRTVNKAENALTKKNALYKSTQKIG